MEGERVGREVVGNGTEWEKEEREGERKGGREGRPLVLVYTPDITFWIKHW